MSDIRITRNAELMVAEVSGLSDVGLNFVDSYLDDRFLQSVDYGRIIVSEEGIEAVAHEADDRGLTVERVEQ